VTEPHAFFAIDQGAATTSAALVGQVSGHWRLLGALALPAGIPLDAILDRLLERVLLADAALGREIGASDLGAAASWPRLVARSTPPPRVAVLAATDATRDRLVRAASAAGWRTASASVERDGPLEVLRLALDPGVRTVVVGTLDPPTGGERSRLGQLSALLGAIEERRPEVTLVLSGGTAIAAVLPEAAPEPAEGAPAATRCFAPGPGSEGLLDDPLVAFLDRLRARPNDAIGGIVRATATLAGIIGRRVETVSIGLDAGARVAAWPTPPTDTDEPAGTAWRAAIVPEAGLVPDTLDEDAVGSVMAWSTVAMDRIRLRDRLAELRRAPWGDADGDGAALRLAAARAALVRLVDATPAIDELPPPDLIVATGGAFAVAPGPAVALALADTLRRPGACQLALDHARLLAPLGVVPEESQRQRLIEDLADDLLAPLGSVISPQGLRAGRSAGRLTIRAGAGLSELELVPGALQLVDLPPGQVATAEFAFSEPVVLGTRGRRFSVEVGGGLGGLLIDLRDVPLRLPDRPEHRRELLVAWQDALWTGGVG
jgi:hypothetical protein